ncbi:MAG TPA: hypothetical protein VK634_01605 [Reyranella sp.]|nr:hypothetical protein [Reyranella sp.]
MRDNALADIGDDLHVGVGVVAEAGARAISSSFQTTRAPSGPFARLPLGDTKKWWCALSQP